MVAPFDKLVERGQDPRGHGDYGMPRGAKRHRGWDVVAEPGTIIKAPFKGEITKYGYMYANAPQFRYIEISNTTYRMRLGYAELMDGLDCYLRLGYDFFGGCHAHVVVHYLDGPLAGDLVVHDQLCTVVKTYEGLVVVGVVVGLVVGDVASVYHGTLQGMVSERVSSILLGQGTD